MMLLHIIWSSVWAAALLFTCIVLVLTAVLLVAKRFLVASGEVHIDINDGTKSFNAPAGGSLLSTLADGGVHLLSLIHI